MAPICHLLTYRFGYHQIHGLVFQPWLESYVIPNIQTQKYPLQVLKNALTAPSQPSTYPMNMQIL
jgi:hypothetical protein